MSTSIRLDRSDKAAVPANVPPAIISGLASGGYDHLAIAIGLHARNQSGTFHLFDQTSRAVVADAQMALYQRDRGAPGFEHDVHGLVVQWIDLGIGLARPAAIFRVGLPALE